MTNEEWDRKAEFLLNQQAKFEAGMLELKEAQQINEQKSAEAMATAERAAAAVLGVARTVDKLIETVAEFIAATQEGFRDVYDRMTHTDDKIDVLVSSQMQTEEQLRETDRRLRDLFERHIREDHEGLTGAEN